MHETATDLVRELLWNVQSQRDTSRLVVGRYEEILKNPLNCCVHLPGRTMSPAMEMLNALHFVDQAWEIAREKKVLATIHPLGHLEINESMHFDIRGGVINGLYSSMHFELADLSLTAPAFIQILLAHEFDVELGHMRVYTPVLSRNKDMFEAEKSESTTYVEPFALTRNHVQWISENKMFCAEGPALGYTEHFFRKVAGPLARSLALSDNDHDAALQSASECAWAEWAAAQISWLETGNA